MKPRAVLIVRVSSTKQAIENNSNGQQLIHGINFIESQGWIVDRSMEFVESGRSSDREFFQEVIDYCVNPKNKISFLVARDISRFTRQGGVAYKQLKDKLKKAGVQLQDFSGTIKPEKNTMEKYGLEYGWSRHSPSEAEEIKIADQAKDQVRQNLTLMIGAEIEYERSGYSNRKPPFGFTNKKIQTVEHGNRNILVERKNESVYIKKLFKMRAGGLYEDKEIVSRLNDLGYKSRRTCRRDVKTKQIIGYRGGKELTVKQLQMYVKNPAYAGVVCTKWTHYKAVKGQFEGLVGVDVFNSANKGKIVIDQVGNRISIRYNSMNEKQGKAIKRRVRNNLLYPYKNVVLCPHCSSTPKASASTGKGGIKYPGYHCSRGHKYWRVSRKDFHNTIYSFIEKLEFSDEYVRLFEESFLEVLKEKRNQSIEDSEQAERSVADLLLEQKDIVNTLKLTKNKSIIRDLERDYDEVEDKIEKARGLRVSTEKKELNHKRAIKKAVYLMEHLEELLIDKDNPLQQQQLFGLTFDEFPTYEDVLSGTPKLSLAFKLNQQEKLSKSDMVTPLGIEPRLQD